MANLPTVHMIVKNEDRWVWFAISSVIDYCKEMIIFNTGSIDKTVEIIKTFNSKKIKLEEKGVVNAKQMVDLRNEQISKTSTDWFLVVDGDEVWPKKSIETLINTINKSPNIITGIVVKPLMCLGDIYHFQDENAGRYHIAGRIGHYNIRAYRKEKDYRWEGVYPNEAYSDNNHISLQNREEKIRFLDAKYWHLTHLERSSVVKNPKKKYEIGSSLPISLPEVFSKERPSIVPSPWRKFSTTEYIVSLIMSPFRKIKRKIY